MGRFPLVLGSELLHAEKRELETLQCKLTRHIKDEVMWLMFVVLWTILFSLEGNTSCKIIRSFVTVNVMYEFVNERFY